MKLHVLIEQDFVNESFRRSRSIACAFVAHTAREMVCFAQAGKFRLAQEASARKLVTTAGSAFVGPMAVKSCPLFLASLQSSAKNFAAYGPSRQVDDKTKGIKRLFPSFDVSM